jgi:DNA polymerase-3 subunit delta'
MFENILGQDKIKNFLSNQIKNKKLSHAYIFMGQNSIGRKSIAFELAKILNCSVNEWDKTDIGPCGHCSSCVKISKNIHPDIHLIDFAKQATLLDKSEKSKTIRIGTVRKGIQDIIYGKPHEAAWRFFIIDKADSMENEASNALLKVLEEPPPNNIFILISRYKDSMLQTILSRCRILFFSPLKQKDIIAHLVKNCHQTQQEAEFAASLSEGSMPDLETISNLSGNQSIEVFDSLLKKSLNAFEILELSKNIVSNREEALEFIDLAVNKMKANFRIYPQEFSDIIDILFFYRELILKNINYQIAFDNMFLNVNKVASDKLPIIAV